MNKSIYNKAYKFLLERLKAARLEAGMEQSDAAKKLKCNVSYISKVESGQLKLDIIQLKELADLYNKDIGYFIEYKVPAKGEKKQNVEAATLGAGKKKPGKKLKKVGARIKDFFTVKNTKTQR
jgi:transcriptional regulator with XRE-family HTH domain